MPRDTRKRMLKETYANVCTVNGSAFRNQMGDRSYVLDNVESKRPKVSAIQDSIFRRWKRSFSSIWKHYRSSRVYNVGQRNALISPPGDNLDHSRSWVTYRIRDDHESLTEKIYVCLAVIVYSREKGIAQETDLPSIFFLSDRGLPFYLFSFLFPG